MIYLFSRFWRFSKWPFREMNFSLSPWARFSVSWSRSFNPNRTSFYAFKIRFRAIFENPFLEPDWPFFTFRRSVKKTEFRPVWRKNGIIFFWYKRSGKGGRALRRALRWWRMKKLMSHQSRAAQLRNREAELQKSMSNALRTWKL